MRCQGKSEKKSKTVTQQPLLRDSSSTPFLLIFLQFFSRFLPVFSP
jgi:hypothetical protein